MMHLIRPLLPTEARKYKIDMGYAYGRKANPYAGREPLLVRQASFSGVLDSLRIRRLFNLGNHVRQVTNAIRFAELHEIPQVILPVGSIFKAHTVGNVRLVTETGPRLAINELVGDYFYYNKFGINDAKLDRARILKMLRPAVSLNVGSSRPGAADLVIHLRAGDVYTKNPHPLYGPPPLTFFTSSIRQSAPERVFFVCQSSDHPYVSKLADFCIENGIEHFVQCGELLDDFNTMRAATNLVISQGTLAMAAAWLSDNCANIWAFGREESEISTLQSLGLHVSHATSRSVRPWSGRTEQADELLLMGPETLDWSQGSDTP